MVCRRVYKPYFVPKFINDSYACITGRGTHKAVGKVQHYMKVAKEITGMNIIY